MVTFCTYVYEKRDAFVVHITNFPFLSHLLMPIVVLFHNSYSKACSSHKCFILKVMGLSSKLLGQVYVKERIEIVSYEVLIIGQYGDHIRKR